MADGLVDASLQASDVNSLRMQGENLWGEIKSAGNGDLGSMLALGTLLAQNLPPGDAANVVHSATNIAEGAMSGAAAGSVIPGYGTVIGAAVGAVLAGMQALMQAQAHPDDPDPGWMQVARSLPGPNNPDRSAPTNAQAAGAIDLWKWQAARFGHLADWMSPEQNVAAARQLWNYPGTAADVATDPNGNLYSTAGMQGDVQIQIGRDPALAAMSRFARWVESYPPLWLPDGALEPMPSTYAQSDRYGWALALGLWEMAVQGNGDLDALHWFLMQQSIVYAKGGPDPEDHCAYMIGYLSTLVAQAPPLVQPRLSNTQLLPIGGSAGSYLAQKYLHPSKPAPKPSRPAGVRRAPAQASRAQPWSTPAKVAAVAVPAVGLGAAWYYWPILRRLFR